MQPFSMLVDPRPAVLLASTDQRLVQALRDIFAGLGVEFTAVSGGDEALSLLGALNAAGNGVLLLDARMPGVANGRLLAASHEHKIRSRWPIALITEHVSDDWIARLREGVIDDIVPRSADAAAWTTHLSTMQRGHALYREVELLREHTLLEVKHDPVTGLLNRDTMLTILFRETDRVQRLHGDLSLMAIGLTNLPDSNEAWSSGARDQLLREVARRSGRLLRTYDALGRLGSNQFLLILPGCSTVSAALLAERIRMETFGEPFWVKPAQGEIVEIRLSACFGIALSRGRSPVVVLRETEQTLGHALQQQSGAILCMSDANSGRTEEARLFPEVETLAW